MVTMVTTAELPKTFAYSSKANAIKEVETWANDLGGNTRDSTVRSVGQIVDNITEGRLLRTKVMELSKERYKFRVQSDYDKKFFVEAQQRKLKAMPDLLRGIDVEYWLNKKPRRRARTVRQLQASGDPVSTYEALSYGAQVAAADNRSKAAADVGGLKAAAAAPRNDAPRRQCVTPAPPACSQRSARGGSATAQHGSPRRVATSLGVAPTSASPRPPADPGPSEWVRASTDLQPARLQRRRQTLSVIAVNQSFARDAGAAPTAAAKSKAETVANSGVRPNAVHAAVSGPPATVREAGRAVADIRYVKLEDSLADKYSCEAPMEVSAIVHACRALHVPSTAGTRYMKPKLGGHIAEYLRQRKLIS